MIALETKGLSLRKKDKTLLDDVSVSVTAGKLVGLIGPNGAGKTTLLKTLSGLEKDYEGSVLFKGINLADWKPRSLARELAYLPQGHEVHWPITVAKMVELGRLPHGGFLRSLDEQDKVAIRKSISELSLEHLADQPFNRLSGGERARAALARVLATEARTILADEPVAALDPFHQLQVMTILRDLARKGYLVCTVLHDLPLAARYCDRLILMNRGKIVADGAPRNILNTENLGRVFDIVPFNTEVDGDFLSLPWSLCSSKQA
ncbi:ABC transporter ATP-binding protein [Kiloniella sp. b19]|uniref:ABC transporter ATP-binding protein n=1 Tax=Kiloniella sp. GXU_MW_B19 TaxID=3141326 RepID=UPI0031E45A3E